MLGRAFLTLLFAGCIPCQEEGNIPYVIENQVGAYSESPSVIAQIVADWLAPENRLRLHEMSSRAHSLGRPQATYDIVHDLAGTNARLRFRVPFRFITINIANISRETGNLSYISLNNISSSCRC